MKIYGAFAILLGFAVAGSSPAQTTNHLREAYPLCFEVFPDEGSEEHKVCIETWARNPSRLWGRDTLENSVQLELGRRKEAQSANEKLRAKRDDPDALEFKGIAIGSDLRTIEATGRFNCRPSTDPTADRTCTLKYGQQETIAGARVKLLLLRFYSDRLEAIGIFFDPKDFSSVTDALSQKYGAGASTTESIQNRMGATFENRKLTWRKGNAFVRAERYFGKLDTSMVTYQSDFSLEEFARRRESSVKSKAKGDL
jgi:hypothetical protein